VARLRDRGHSLDEIKAAAEQGRLAYGLLEDLFPPRERAYSAADAAEETGLEPELIRRIWLSMGFSRQELRGLTEEDMQALRWVSSVLDAGFPLVAFLQLARVYGQALSHIADAETRLFHIYVHEPLMREGVPSLEMAEEMADLGRDLLPLASPIMDYIHQRYLAYFSSQDVVGTWRRTWTPTPPTDASGRRSRLRTWPGTRATSRRRARRRRCPTSSASSTPSATRSPTAPE